MVLMHGIVLVHFYLNDMSTKLESVIMNLKGKGSIDAAKFIKSYTQDLYDSHGNVTQHEAINVKHANLSYDKCDFSFSVQGGVSIDAKLTFNHANNHVQINNEITVTEHLPDGRIMTKHDEVSTGMGDNFIELDAVKYHTKQHITFDMDNACKSLPHDICATSVSEFNV